MYVILVEGLEDCEYIEVYIIGFEVLENCVKDYDFIIVVCICGIDEDIICNVVCLYVKVGKVMSIWIMGIN